jgi:hypothetical protein
MEGAQTYQAPKVLQFIAKLISYVFHPLFIPTYIFLFLVYKFPFAFQIDTRHDAVFELKLSLFSTFWMTAFFPAFAVFILWRLKVIKSIFLRTQKERIIPFFINMFFYWWMYYLSINMANDKIALKQPEVLKFFYFGIFISTVVGVLINNFIKISLHGLAAGGALAAVILFSLYYHANINIYIVYGIILTGCILTARLIVSNHTQTEIYTGLLVGIACQLIGYWWAM